MLRTIFSIGIVTLLGILALNLVFGIFGVVFGILGGLFWLAVKIAIVGGVVYLAIYLVSPDTARRLRSRSSD